jgi:osmoprotectant transport system permease protein
MTFAQQRPFIDWDWIVRNFDQIVDRTGEHLLLTLVPVVVGLVLSLLLSLIAIRWRKSYGSITAVTGILYTIPSLAAFAFMVPVVGLNATNAVIALTSYTLLILVRNIVAGIDGVPASILEAADGMGLTRNTRFWRTELPLAIPVIIAGLRIATVTTVGLVTVTAVLGLGGYGFFILRGFNTFFWTQVLVGVVLCVGLATILDLVLIGVRRWLAPWQGRRA